MMASTCTLLKYPKIFGALALFIFTGYGCFAQDVQVSGGFIGDSVKIGERTAYYLTASYPEEVNILFPDSTFDFAPFEYMSRRYFPTETRNGISRDSTVFFLNTFELDSVQKLSLPAFVVNQRDCTVYLSPVDSMMLIHLVKAMPDTVALQELPLLDESNYRKVRWQLNHYLVVIILTVLVILAIASWVIFGERIRKHFRVKSLMKKHKVFVKSYGQIVTDVQHAKKPTESALTFWKKYMESLEGRPYTKLTTPETFRLHQDNTLLESLKSVDRAIYGYSDAPAGALEQLKIFADTQFHKKLKEVNDGK